MLFVCIVFAGGGFDNQRSWVCKSILILLSSLSAVSASGCASRSACIPLREETCAYFSICRLRSRQLSEPLSNQMSPGWRGDSLYVLRWCVLLDMLVFGWGNDSAWASKDAAICRLFATITIDRACLSTHRVHTTVIR